MNAISSAAAAPEPVVIPRHVKRIAIVVILGAIMSVLDTTIVNVALQSLSQDLAAPLDQVQWVVTGYLLAIAAVLPITGWAANRFGARRVYMTSLVLLHARLAPVRLRVEHRVAHRLPRPAGDRRRSRAARRPDHPREGRRARARCRGS